MTTKPNRLAVITGPTSGIGYRYTIELAQKGYNLLLVARREDRLIKMTQSLSEANNIEVDYIVADLSQEDEIKKVGYHLQLLNHVEILVNNAGFGVAGFFLEVSLEEQLKMINVHLTSTIRFSKAVLPAMIKQKHGYIVNMASFAAFMELPGSVIYSTTKAAIIKFSQTLQSEVSNYGVKIQALSPGFTPTAFHQSIKREAEFVDRIPPFLWTSIEKVVQTSLSNLDNNNVICIPGVINHLLFLMSKSSFLSRLMQNIAVKRQKEQVVPESVVPNQNLQKTEVIAE
ncbi:SDR family NAD(P)-dependent oxidoreductase [Carboxylicivirga marina]|uniref:SDR family oxidoreductase n=1 Tax=Carboxylicivirga marina TaxID=2800988 RepID=A0ABS1HL01_9BACT|nr:SDR family oxidoreductase [Carboxylicivirga marina]MBK3518321.1 SDR family oxidoreductase [Carboxylicivirga marina]